MRTARLIRTDGHYLEAFIEVDGQTLCVEDEFSCDETVSISPGERFDVAFDILFKEDEPWESMFSGNPDHRIGIEKITGWSYRAFGCVVSVNPVKVDIGLLVTSSPIATHDERVVGEFVAFTIDRLTAIREC